MVVTYRWVDRINRLIKIEDGLKDYWEAVDYCRIYNKKARGNYLFYSFGKWFVYDPWDGSAYEV